MRTGPKGPIPEPNFGRHTGLGDMVLWTAFSNTYTPPNIFGFGPTMMLPTATYRTLTTGKFSMGPMALAFHTGKKWIIGTVAQHWWTVTGDRNRGHVNLTDIQYVRPVPDNSRHQYRLWPQHPHQLGRRRPGPGDVPHRFRGGHVDQTGALAGQGGVGIPLLSHHPRGCRAPVQSQAAVCPGHSGAGMV